ncbi:MAG: hypothetical protein K1X55_16870 [Chitinophagales bacterium]|nr:hypothetical protein [Chitinophagales bacterium]
MKEEIIKIVSQLGKKHLDDPTKSDDFNNIVNILLKSESQAIDCLNELDENSISWVSFSFEDLSYKFQSQEFINCLNRLVVKFPNISYLKDDVQDAIDAM